MKINVIILIMLTLTLLLLARDTRGEPKCTPEMEACHAGHKVANRVRS